jgi:hypothetical protein
MRFRGHGFFKSSTISVATGDRYCSYEEYNQMDHETKTETKKSFVDQTFHENFMSWTYLLTNPKGRISGLGTLYHESLGQPVRGRNNLI